MKDIKFRVYEKPTNYMRYEIERNPSFYLRLQDKQQVKMQYIGIKDKKGKDIYEGDICADYDEACIGKIQYYEEDACFYYYILLEDGGFQAERLYDYPDIEVVGNIYQNSELLEECSC